MTGWRGVGRRNGGMGRRAGFFIFTNTMRAKDRVRFSHVHHHHHARASKKKSHTLLHPFIRVVFVVTVNGYWPLCYHPCHTWRDGDGSSSSCDVFCAVGEAPSGWLFVPGTQTHVLRFLLFLLLCPCSTAWCLLPLHDVRTTKMSRGTSWHS